MCAPNLQIFYSVCVCVFDCGCMRVCETYITCVNFYVSKTVPIYIYMCTDMFKIEFWNKTKLRSLKYILIFVFSNFKMPYIYIRKYEFFLPNNNDLLSKLRTWVSYLSHCLDY